MTTLGVFSIAAQYADQFIMWHFLGPVALATYSIAQGPTKELRTFAENFTSIAFPKIAQRGPTESIKSGVVTRRGLQLFLVTLCMAAVYILIAPILFKIFFPVYMDAVWYSQLIVLGLLFSPRGFADSFLFAHSGIKDRYIIMIPNTIARIILFAVLIPLFGITGAVAAMLISELFYTCTVFALYFWFKRNHMAV